MNGAGTISIPAGRIIDIELIGTTWKDNLTGNLVGNVTGNLTGNASTATALETARYIGSALFNGSANITQQDMNVCQQTHLPYLSYGADYLYVIAGPWGASNANHAANGSPYQVRLVAKTLVPGTGQGSGVYIQELRRGSSAWVDRTRL